MNSQTIGINGSKFETLESRVMLTGAFPSAAENAIIYDAKGNLDVAYYDSTAHDLKFVQQTPAGTWSTPTVIDSSSSDVGQYVTIALNKQGLPAVAYQDTANADLKFAQYDGTSSWTVSVVDKRKTTGFNPSLTFDAQGEALISYYKKNTGDLDLATHTNNKKWTLTTLVSSGNVGQFSSIAINPASGKPAVAYTNANGQVQYVSKTKNTYSKPTTVGATTGASGQVSLAFGGSGASIGYVDTGGGTVNLAQPNGKKFTKTTIGSVSTDGSATAQVLIDPTTGQPDVVYHDSTGTYVAQNSGSGTTFTNTKVQDGGSMSTAVIQPGSGSLVFSSVTTTGGTLSISTTSTPPAAPTNVAAASDSTDGATITWDDNSDNEAGFLIERSANGTTFTTAGTVGPNITTFADSGLTEGTTYYYRVSAIGAAGNNSAGTTGSGGSQIVPATALATVTTLAAAPSAVAANAVSASSITVTWTDNSQNELGYLIARSADNGNTWTTAGSVGANITTFTDTGLTEGTSYSYVVSSYNSNGLNASATTALAYTLPAAPSNVVATTASATEIDLTWQNNSAVATGFIIQRSTDDVSFTTIANVGPTVTSYSDPALSQAFAYYYQILATGPGSQTSAPSATTNAITDPLAPSNVVAAAISSSRIDLTWTDNTTTAIGYIVQRSSNGGAYANITTLSGTAVSFSDTGRTEGVSYSYRVQAITATGESGFSAPVTASTLPAAPTNLTATSSGTSVLLSWTNNSVSATGFDVQRSSDNGATWSKIALAPVNGASTITYVDATTGQGATYSYQVDAVNVAGHSPTSNVATATLAPAAPTGLTASAISATAINLAWTDNSLGETGILIERSLDQSNWTVVNTAGAAAETYPDSGLQAGTTYYYRISATNAGGASTYSTANAITAPLAPTALIATTASVSEIDLSWTPAASATSYLVETSPDGVGWSVLNTADTTSLTDLNLTEGTEYFFRVIAINAGGSSVASSSASATTLPAAPTGATATGVSPTSVLVSWTNVSTGATALVVQRSLAAGEPSWTTIANPAANQTSITDSTVTEATSYIYQVQAVVNGEHSSFASTAAVTTIPAAPTNLSATIISSMSVSLQWTSNSQGATNYVVQRSTDGVNFNTIDTVSGTTTADVDNGAGAGTQYWYRVYATDAGGSSDFSNVQQATTTPAAPQNVTATAVSPTLVTLSWDAAAGATGYSISRSTDGQTFVPFDTSATNTYMDTAAVEGTEYWYTVTATNSSGSSVPSSIVNATTVPAAPTSLVVVSNTDTQVVLGWANNSENDTNYKIERSDDNGLSFSQIDTAAANATTYTDNTAVEGTHYIYRVRATGAGGDSDPSNSVGVDTNPSAPTGLTVSVNSATDVTLSWTDVSTNATNYVVARNDGNGFVVVNTLGPSANSYDDTVTEGGSYQYEVRATQLLSDNVTTVLSDWTTPQSVSTPPAAPTNVQAVPFSASEVDLSWQNVSNNATGIRVYRADQSMVFGLIQTLPATQQSYQDTTVSAGTSYYYEVRAFGPGGESAPGVPTSVTSIPAAPDNVSASTALNPSVTLDWSDVAGETGFAILRSTDGGQTFDQIDQVGQGVVTYTDTSAVEDTTYQYEITAANASGISDPSAPVSVTTYLAAPTALGATATATQVALSWTDNSIDATGYEVQRNDGSGWVSVTTALDASATSFVDTTVNDGTAYSYQVRALGPDGASDFTPIATATTSILAPSALVATSVSATEVDLSWTNNSATATGYQILRSTDDGVSFQQIDAVQNTAYADVTLTAGQSVQYEVTATNSTGVSLASSPVVATALPATPSGLTATPVDTGSINLTWTDNSDGATGYQIWRTDANGSTFSLLFTAGPTDSTYTDSGLSEASTYSYEVAAVNSGGSTPFSNIAQAETYSAAPTNLAATTTNTTATLTWTNNSLGANGCAVEISSDGGTTFNLVTAALSGSATTYTVQDLSEATSYEFQVYTRDDAGASTLSNTVAATTVPNAPTLITPTVASDGIHLSWTNNSSGATGFTVQRVNAIGSANGVTFPLSVSQTTYTDSTAVANTAYVYTVVADDAGGSSVASASQLGLALPVAPTNLVAASTTSSSISLSWTPDANGAAGYTINRSTDGTNFSFLGAAGSNDSSYVDTTALAGTTYTYQVIATNTSGSAATVTSQATATLTAAPTGVATTSIAVNSVSLTWNDVTGETGFQIERSTDNVTFTSINSVGAGQLSYTDSTAGESTAYYYKIAAIDASGTGDASQSISVLTLPAAPTAFVATPVSATQVNLSWTTHSQGATGYKIYRSANSGPSLLLHTVLGNVGSYNDASAASGTSYVYTVSAYNATGSSSSITQTALTVPGQVQNLAAIAASASEIDLTWAATAGAANYTILRSTDNATWTSLGTVNSTVLSLNDGGRTEATLYYYNVTASNATGSGQTAAVSTTTLPASVTTLMASSPSPTVVNLTWVDTSLGATNYHVYRSSDAGQNFTLIQTLGGSANSYQDNVSEGTAYDYRIAPVDASGDGIAADVSIATLPATPTLDAVTPASATVVNLTWTNNSAHATGFTVERTIDGENDWSILNDELLGTATNYSDTTALPGTEYQYKVIAQSATGNSADSNIISALTVPGVVASVVPTAVSTTEIDLTWTPVSGADSYSILRSTNGINFTSLDSVDSPTTSYDDTNLGAELIEGTRYYYMIVAVDGSGDGDASSAVYTSTLASAPTGLTATAVSNHQVNLSWTNTSNGADGVNVEQSTDNSSWTLLAPLDPSADSYSDSSVSGGSTYYYRVAAVDEGGTNYMSDQASVSALTKPDAPTITATSNTDGTVSLNWTAPTGASTYTVQHSPDGSTWTNVATATSSLTVDDTGLTENSTYLYRVAATNASGDSSFSSTVSTLTVPEAPTDLVATSVQSTDISLTWSGDSSGNVSYTVYRADNGSQTFTQVGDPITGLTYSDLTVTPGNSYVYEVLASNASGANATPAISSSVVPVPPSPASLAAVAASDTTVNLSWATSAGATSYKVYRKAAGDLGFTLLTSPSLAADAVSYSDTAASGGIQYTYDVEAINASGYRDSVIGALTSPSTPTGIAVSVVDNHDLQVTWNADTGATSYTLQRSADGGSTWTNVNGISGTGVTDTVAGGGTYIYQLSATNASGTSGVETSDPVTVVPDAPANVTATASSDMAIHVTWSLSSGATGYVVKQSTDNGINYTAVSGTLGSGVSSYDDMGLSELTSYKYEVVASNGAGNSAASAPAAAVTLPTAPSALFTTAVSTSEVDLSWTDNSAGQTGFDVQRNGVSGWATIGTTLAGVTTYADMTVSAGTSYSYRVIADNGSVMSVPTAPLPVLTVPAAPGSIVATPSGASSVGLTWTVPQSATSFNILRSDNGGAFASVMTGVTDAFYTDNSVVGGTTYIYEIQSVNATGPGAIGMSNSVLTVPAAQTDFAAAATSSTQVHLSWTDVAGATSYTIERSTGSGFTAIAASPVTAIGVGSPDSVNDTTVAPGTTYTYEILGTDATGNSVTTMATALTNPGTVAGVSGTVASYAEIDLTWTDDTGIVTGYRVLESVNGGTFAQVGSDLANTATSLQVTGLSAATSYVFDILAINATGVSAVSDTNSLTTFTLAPTNLTATAVSAGQINLAWTDAAGATGYEVDRSPDGSTNWQSLSNMVAGGATSYQDMTVAAGTNYYYRVEGLDAGGASTPATTATALTNPAAPTTFTTTTINAGEVDLSWDAMTGASSYTITRSVNGGSFNPLISNVMGTSYPDTSVSGGTTYQYDIVAVNATGASTITTGSSVLTIPAAQSDFAATPISTGEVDLAWTDVTGATSYSITRSVNGGSYSPLGSSLSSNTHTYADHAVAGGTTYSYKILGTDATGNSTITTASALTIPIAVQGFSSQVVSNTEIDLSWAAPTDTVTGFQVLQSLNGGVYAQVGSNLASSATSFPVTGLTPATHYAYEVLAFNGTGSSAVVTTSTLTTLTNTPTNFTATGASASAVNLVWTDVSGATAYEVDRSTDGGVHWTTVTNVLGSGASSYQDTGLAAGTIYTYQVEALDAGGPSAPTASQNALTAPPTSASVTATPSTSSANTVAVNWTASKGAATYTILRSDNGGSYAQIATLVAGVSYNDTAALAGTSEAYEVVAVNATGVSGAATSDAVLTIPAAQGDFAATPASSTQVNLTWTDVTGATSYTIERETGSGGFSPIAASPVTALGAGMSDGVHDTTAVAGTTYTYEIFGTDATGNSATTAATALTYAAAPASVVATPNSAASVGLTWAASTSATTYTILRSVNGGGFGFLTGGISLLTYTDSSAVGGTTYAYEVEAVNASGTGAAGTSNSVLTVPAAQSDFAASPVSASEVDLSWTDVAGATSYTIEREIGSSGFAPITGSPVTAIGAGMADGIHDTTVAGGISYTYKIIGNDATGPSAATMATALTVPATVGSVNGTVISASEIDLTWADDSGVVSGYRVYKTPTGGSPTQVGSDLSSSADSLPVTGLTAATGYVFDVVAFNDSGAGADSNTSTLTTHTLPPTGFSATPVSDTEVDLAWTGAAGATGYEVDRSTDGGATWTLVTNSLGSGVSSYNDTGLADGTSYKYYVVALDAGGASQQTNWRTALTFPSAQGDFAATPVSATSVNLTWTDVTGADSYTIERKNGGGGFSIITDPVLTPVGAGSSDSYSDTTAAAGTTYTYEIFATNASGSSTATSVTALTAPAAPTNVNADNMFGSTEVFWNASTGAATYNVLRSVNGGAFTSVETGGSGTNYDDNSLTTGTSYQYEIVAVNASGSSSGADSSTVWTAPARPLDPTATAVSATEIDISWVEVPGVVDYSVYRTSGGPYDQIVASITAAVGNGGATDTFDDTNLSPGTEYGYYIDDTNTGGRNTTSTFAGTTLPAAVASLNATVASSTEIDLTWTADTGVVTGYYVYRSVNGGAFVQDGSELADNAASLNDTGLTPATNYAYEVIAVNGSGNSAISSTSTLLTLPDTPGSFAVSSLTSSEVDLSWDAVAGATGYHVLKWDGSEFSPLATVTDGTTYPDTSLDEGTEYQYEVTAYNATGDGAAAGPLTPTTLLNSPTVVAGSETTTSITITWTDNSASETGYKLEQLTAPDTWTDITGMGDGGAIMGTGSTGSQTVTGLTEGMSYSFRVTALSGSNFDSTPTVVDASTAPNDPTAVTVSPSSPNGVVVSWTNNSANPDGFQIQRSSDAGMTWSIIDTTASQAATYTDSTTTEGTAYEYEVAEYKGTTFSNFVTSSSVTARPSAPTGLTPSVVSATQINLAWTDVSTHATSYRVYSSTDNSTFVNISGGLASNATSYDDTAAAEDTTTYYRVVAVVGGVESVVAAGNTTSAVTPLAAPSGVNAATTTDVSQSDKTINVGWTNVSTVATLVKIERSSDAGSTWSPIVTLPASDDGYADTSALENTTYLYRVYSVDGNGVTSTHSQSNSIKSLLSRPTNMAVASPTSTTVTVTWTDISSAATDYHIERSTNGVDFMDVGHTNSASATSFTDTGLVEGTMYWYRVRATSGSNTSNYSDTNFVVTIPTTPTGLAVSAFSTTEIDLAWTDPSTTATSYDVQQSSDGGTTWGTIATGLADNATSYPNTGLTEATDYEYRVFAIGGGGASLDSNVVTQTTKPNTPTGLTSTATTANSVSLSWTDNSAGETNYEVERSTGAGWTVLTTSLPANTTTYTDSTAAEGTAYMYRVRDNRNGTESAYSTIYNVTTPPAAPSGLNVTSTTSTRVSLSWTDNSNGETGFSIQRSTDGGTTWSQVGTVGANSTTYNDNTVGEGLSYSYNVFAYNAGGNSTNSNNVTANIVPASPSGLTASPITPTGVTLTWTNNSSHQTGFYVQSKISGTWTTIATVTSGVTYTVTTTEDTAYNYRVAAYGPSGTSGYSLTVTGTTPLNAPSGLTAATVSTTSINLSWTDNSNAESFYEVQRSADGGDSWTTVTSTLPANTTTYQDNVLTEGSTYTYQVKALRTGANSAFSATAAATTLPAAPTFGSATVNSDTQITVTWTNNSVGATGFTIQRSTNGGTTWTAAGTVAGNVATFADTGLSELTPYSYRIEATNAGGASTWVTSGSAVTTLPSPPSSLMISAPASDRIALTWTDNSQGATAYQIYRQANGGGFTLLTTLGASATSYTDFSVLEATAYDYKVRTVSNGSYSAYSNTASLTTVPLAPDTLVATPVSSSEIDLTWNDNSANATHYLVERSTDQGATFTVIATLGATATSYPDTGLPEDSDFQYQVRAEDAGGYSDYTNSAEAITFLATPTNLVAAASAGHIALTWTNNSTQDTGFTVMRSADNGSTWQAVADLAAGSTSFSDTGSIGGLNSGTTYKYRVYCFDSNDASTSANSNVAMATAV